MSSQVKVIRAVSRDKLAITLLWPYQSVCVLLFDSLLSLMTEQLITMSSSSENIILFAYVRNNESLLILSVVLTILHCYISEKFYTPTGDCHHYIYSPTQIFTCIWCWRVFWRYSETYELCSSVICAMHLLVWLFALIKKTISNQLGCCQWKSDSASNDHKTISTTTTCPIGSKEPAEQGNIWRKRTRANGYPERRKGGNNCNGSSKGRSGKKYRKEGLKEESGKEGKRKEWRKWYGSRKGNNEVKRNNMEKNKGWKLHWAFLQIYYIKLSTKKNVILQYCIFCT